MKILILCDHYPLSPRVIKMRNSILKIKECSEVEVFCWNRKNQEVTEDYVVPYNKTSEYGNFLKNAFGIINFIEAAKNHIKKYNPFYIHAIDLPMLIAAAASTQTHRIIYEVYDIKSVRNSILNKIRETIEVFIINKRVDKLIYASPYFYIYYNNKLKINKKYINLNNKPNESVGLTKTNYMEPYKERIRNKMVIGFVGNIRHKELLLNLIYAINLLEGVVVLLAGEGIAADKIKSDIKNKDVEKKVIFTGRFESIDLSAIYESCNYVWAAYPNKTANVMYAVSNKFYECIVFRTKIIVSNNTFLSEDVIKNDIGYVIDPYDKNDIKKMVLKLKEIYSHDVLNTQMNSYWEDDELQLPDIY